MNFQQYYRKLFDSFGYPLSQKCSIPSASLATAGKSLGVVIPPALSEYYAVAGREKRLNQSHNRLLPIDEWQIEKKRLIFMEENQAVVVWGVSIGNPQNDDPPVSQSVNDDEFQWFQESRRCSTFIAVMLHFQAVFGGFKHCARAAESPELKRKLKAGWTCYGTVNRLTAYSRQNQIVCLEPDFGVLVAGTTKKDLGIIENELGLKLC